MTTYNSPADALAAAKSRVNNRVEHVRHTIYGQHLQASLLLGKTYQAQPGTTLNEKLNIYARSSIDSTERVRTVYYAIGNGAHTSMPVKGQFENMIPLYHDPLDGAPYEMMPFALKGLTNDFPEEVRSQYRLRRKEEHNGKEYWAYYLKLFEMEEDTKILIETTENGQHTVTPFVVTENVLSPKRPIITPNEKVTASNVKVKVSNAGRIHFNEHDVDEYANVCKILYGTGAASVISEIALVAGVDSEYTSPDDSTRYTEVKSAITVAFISTYHQLNFSNTGFTETLELGEKIPLPTTSEILATKGEAPESIVVPGHTELTDNRVVTNALPDDKSISYGRAEETDPVTGNGETTAFTGNPNTPSGVENPSIATSPGTQNGKLVLTPEVHEGPAAEKPRT